MSDSKHVIWLHCGKDPKGWNDDPQRPIKAQDFLEAEPHFEVVLDKDVIDCEETLARVSGVWSVDWDDVVIKAAPYMPKCRAVTYLGKGLDNVPVKEFSELGIAVANGGNSNAISVAEAGIMLVLASARQLRAGLQLAMGTKEMSRFRLNDLGIEVSGKTLGIVGLGSIGFMVAKRAVAFDMKIYYHNRNRRPEIEKEIGATYWSSLHDMLPHCDFVMIICPLTPQTEKMFGDEEFIRMKNSGTLVNIARGQIVDQEALVQALKSGTIRAAALDATHPEPLPHDHPLLNLDNVIITPHYSSATVENRRRMCQCMVHNLKAVLIESKDRMPNQVN